MEIGQKFYKISWNGQEIECGQVKTKPGEQGGFWADFPNERTAFLKRGEYHLTERAVAEENLQMLQRWANDAQRKADAFETKAKERGWLGEAPPKK